MELKANKTEIYPRKKGSGKKKKRMKGQGRGKQEAEKALCEVSVLGMKKQ